MLQRYLHGGLTPCRSPEVVSFSSAVQILCDVIGQDPMNHNGVRQRYWRSIVGVWNSVRVRRALRIDPRLCCETRSGFNRTVFPFQRQMKCAEADRRLNREYTRISPVVASPLARHWTATSDLRLRLVPVVTSQLGTNEITRAFSRRERNGRADSRKSDGRH